MHKRNTEVRPYNLCCRATTKIITYSECVSVTLGIHHAMHMRHIAICDLPRSTIFFHIISQTVRFSGKKVIEHKMCVLIVCTACV
jgi:hypothetical protein